MTRKVLVLEDEANIRSFVVINLKRAGYDAIEAGTGEEALALIQQNPDIQVALLDIMLPGEMDGFEVCRRIRAGNSQMGIIMLTARTQEMDKVSGLMTGADDYVTKPFTPLELLARVNSHLRRYSKYLSALKEDGNKDHIYTIGGLELNEDTVEVSVDGEPVKLTPMEFKIVQLLIKNPGRVFSADEIYERIWNEKAVNTDTIMVHVRNIREKIEIDPANPRYLKVVWGLGYKMEKMS